MATEMVTAVQVVGNPKSAYFFCHNKLTRINHYSSFRVDWNCFRGTDASISTDRLWQNKTKQPPVPNRNLLTWTQCEAEPRKSNEIKGSLQAATSARSLWSSAEGMNTFFPKGIPSCCVLMMIVESALWRSGYAWNKVVYTVYRPITSEGKSLYSCSEWSHSKAG